MTDIRIITAILEQMAATSSRNDKERLTAELVQSEFGQKVLKWTYDPFITFGLTPPRLVGQGEIEFQFDLVEPMLQNLASRHLTGNDAVTQVEEVMEAMDGLSAELLWRILSKDLRVGITATTANLVMPGLVPTFAVMRANAYEAKRVKKWPQIAEPKLDGMRVTFLCKDGNGGFFSRSGNRLSSLDHLVLPVMKIAVLALANSKNPAIPSLLTAGRGWNFMLDAEAISGNRFETIGNTKRGEKSEDTVLHLFDILSYADFDANGAVGPTYLERRALLEEFLQHVPPEHAGSFTETPRYFVNSDAEIQALYTSFQDRGLEGAMVKNPDSLYEKKKSWSWMKLKSEQSEDLPVVGFYNGEPNAKYEASTGGLIVMRANGVLVRVGGGFSDAQREEIWEAWQKDAADLGVVAQPGFKPGWSNTAVSTTPRNLLGRLIEVLYHEETPDGSLGHPRFKRFRDDKAGEIEKDAA
jgi:ATP-dependent DNA ligase